MDVIIERAFVIKVFLIHQVYMLNGRVVQNTN